MVTNNMGPAGDSVGAVTFALLTKLGAPDFVKKAYLEESTAWRDLPPVCYADPRCHYPIHTPTAAVVSAAVFYANRAQDELTGRRIKAACDLFGVSSAWSALTEKVAAAVRRDEPTRFALPESRRYPIDTPARVKAAAAYLREHGDDFLESDRRTYAANLLAADDAAPTLAAADRATVERLAGLGRPAVAVSRVFGSRKAAAVAAGLPRLAVVIERAEAAVKAGGDAYRAAVFLEAVDRCLRTGLGNPAADLTGLTPSAAKAAAARYIQAPDGAWYDAEDLRSVPADHLDAAYDTGPVVSTEKRAQLLATHGVAFRAFLADHGVHPVRTRDVRPAVDWDRLAS